MLIHQRQASPSSLALNIYRRVQCLMYNSLSPIAPMAVGAIVYMVYSPHSSSPSVSLMQSKLEMYPSAHLKTSFLLCQRGHISINWMTVWLFRCVNTSLVLLHSCPERMFNLMSLFHSMLSQLIEQLILKRQKCFNVFTVQREKCIKCRLCFRNCPYHSITMSAAIKDGYPVFHKNTCYFCGLCFNMRPKEAIQMIDNPRSENLQRHRRSTAGVSDDDLRKKGYVPTPLPSQVELFARASS